MHLIFLILWSRLSRAITTAPDLANRGVLLVAIFGVFCTLIIGFVSSFLTWNLCRSKRAIVRIIITSLFAPAILEEIIFRVLLLPYPASQTLSTNNVCWSILSLLVFVIYHPANALTFFPQGKETFLDPVFLTLAAILGTACTLAYNLSGSLWLPVLIHWLAVVLWLLCFGGLTKLHFDE